MFPVDLMYGYYTKHKENNRLDVAIVEASAITEDGGIIPGASVGASPEIIQMADKVRFQQDAQYSYKRTETLMLPQPRLSSKSIPRHHLSRVFTISP